MATCRDCALPIDFVETRRGKLMPVDRDGTVHFSTCPARRRMSRPDLLRRLRVAPPPPPPAPADVCTVCGSLDVERLHRRAIRCRDCGFTRRLFGPVEPEPTPPALPPQGDACSICRSTNVARGPGSRPHHASLRCLDCGAFRWLPKPRLTEDAHATPVH
jgi:hypothetical protein